MRRPAATASAFAFLLFAASAVEARPNPVAQYVFCLLIQALHLGCMYELHAQRLAQI